MEVLFILLFKQAKNAREGIKKLCLILYLNMAMQAKANKVSFPAVMKRGYLKIIGEGPNNKGAVWVNT